MRGGAATRRNRPALVLCIVLAVACLGGTAASGYPARDEPTRGPAPTGEALELTLQVAHRARPRVAEDDDAIHGDHRNGSGAGTGARGAPTAGAPEKTERVLQ